MFFSRADAVQFGNLKKELTRPALQPNMSVDIVPVVYCVPVVKGRSLNHVGMNRWSKFLSLLCSPLARDNVFHFFSMRWSLLKDALISLYHAESNKNVNDDCNNDVSAT